MLRQILRILWDIFIYSHLDYDVDISQIWVSEFRNYHEITGYDDDNELVCRIVDRQKLFSFISTGDY